MTAARLTAALLALLVLAPAASARIDARKQSAPEGLRAFLLQADEPAQDPAKRVFPRTPSFIWKPVPNTVRYEFQLSTSDTFRENGIVYSTKQLTSPLVAPPLSLPWVSGNLDKVPKDPAARKDWLRKTRAGSPNAAVRAALVKWYGEKEGNAVRHAEAFEICE